VSLLQLDLQGLRNLESLSLQPGPRLNFIVGPNASGKTSLLEAIYLLGRGRSFRTHQVGQLIRFGESSLTISGRVETPEAERAILGLKIARGRREIHVDGRPVPSSAALMKAFPLLVIQPSGIVLLEGPPKLRRNFLDFGVFHDDPGFLDYWRRYVKALNQRNVLLRRGQTRDLAPWTHEMARYGIMLHEARCGYLERLMPHFREIGGRFFRAATFDLKVQPGWDLNRSLATILDADVAMDLRHGHTQSGPHRGDFAITLNQKPVRGLVSRGQMKLLVYALLLAQSRLMEDRVGTRGCVLIDDVAAELDAPNRRTLLDILGERTTQFFITATALEAEPMAGRLDASVFEIEQGRLIHSLGP
jgi:DNA replication and repair protein RecF